MTGRELHDFPRQPMGIFNPSVFKTNTACTTNEKSFGKTLITGRGPLISLVDTALKNWDALILRGSGEEKVKALRQIVKVCAYWLQVKNAAAGHSALRTKRTTHIRNLLNAAIAALGNFDPGEAAFAGRKAQAIENTVVVPTEIKKTRLTRHVKSISGMSNPNTKSLDAGYQHERTHYEKHGKKTQETITPGASFAHQNLPMFDQMDWDNLGYDQFSQLIQGIDKNGYTSYLPKGERLQYLILDAGANNLRRPGSQGNYNTSHNDLPHNRGDMWAMDRYGNLFVKDDALIADVGHFNHSSFNAGKEVMCAGMLVINNGVLVSIDNNSGHYKPDANYLREALAFLQAEYHVIVAANAIRVGVVTNNGMQHYDGNSVLNGAAPANWTAWDANNNAALQLAAN